MTHQWPEPYRPKPAAADLDRLVGFIRRWLLLPLLRHSKFGLCLALIGLAMIALLFHSWSSVLYRAQTSVTVTTSLEHQAKSSGDVIGPALQVPSQEFFNAEADLLANPVVVEQTLAHFGIAELYPNFLTSQTGAQMAWDAGIRQFQSSLRVIPIQQSGIIHLTFEHTNASTAAKALNQFVLNYQILRAKILEGRSSKAAEATIASSVKDLEQLEQARREMRNAIGTPDLAQQRAILIKHRNEIDARLRQTVERVQALSVHLADLAQSRSRMVVDAPSSQTDSRARASQARNVTTEQSHPARAVSVQPKEQLVVVQDQAAGPDAVAAKLSSGQSPLQSAPRLLNQFMTRKQGLPPKAAAGAGFATHEARIAQALRDLDSLEQGHAEPKPTLGVATAGQPRIAQRADINAQPQQPESDANGSDPQAIVLAQAPKGSIPGMVPAFAGITPVAITAPEVWADRHWRQLGVLLGNDATDPLIQWLQQRPSVIQEQTGGTRVIPARLPIVSSPDAAAIDQDRFSAQAELDALRARQNIDGVSIGLIDQQLVRLGQADLRLSLLNARIMDQHERVTAAQKLYGTAKAAEEGDQAGIGEIVQTSSEAISVSPVTAGTPAFSAAFASLFLAATILVIAWVSGRRLIMRKRPLELFLNAPRSETD